MLEQKNGRNPGNYSPAVRIPYRNRSGVVELVGRDPLLLARVENGVMKFSPKKNTPFWPDSFLNFRSETAVINGEFSIFWPRKSQLWGGL